MRGRASCSARGRGWDAALCFGSNCGAANVEGIAHGPKVGDGASRVASEDLVAPRARNSSTLCESVDS
nr:MAG TPA: hypothetical protein [Caudoviricetes sp.]